MTSTHETIHSGHFMTSNPHTDPPPDEEDEDVEVDVVDEEKPDEKALKESVATDERPVTYYKFGPQKTQSFEIDVSLNKLNKCIRVAYNKMTTPKWKDFKGLRLHWKQRIRLNNVIWRAYHMEFGRKNREATKSKKKSPYCYFAVPDDDTTHTKIEGTVLEGMYWKRRGEAVCAQYKRWRHFNSKRHDGSRKKKKASSSGRVGGGSKDGRGWGETLQRSLTPKNTSTEYFDIDDLENEFTDTLFESLNQPYMFPNPRDLSELCGNPDIVQPGLLSLQPSLEEIMASLSESPFTSLLVGDDLANEDSLQSDLDLPGPSRANSSSASLPTAPVAPSTSAGPSSSSTGPPRDPSSSGLSASSFPSLGSPLRSPPRPLAAYSLKDYSEARLLLEYSNQRAASAMTPAATPTTTTMPAVVQPTRQSSLGSPMMLSQPQYSTASGYGTGLGGSGLASIVGTSIAGGALGASMNAHQQQLQHLQLGLQEWKAANLNNYLVTGGDVVTPNMDYMPQFLSAPSTAYRLSSTVSPLAGGSGLQSPALTGIPGISSPLGGQQLGAAANAMLGGNARHWQSWMEGLTPCPPSSSTAAPSAPSPLIVTSGPASVAPQAPPTASIPPTAAMPSPMGLSGPSLGATTAVVPPLRQPQRTGKGSGLQRSGRASQPAEAALPGLSSLPRDSLSERLGRSVLASTGLPQAPPSSASAENANTNPWDAEDPGPSGVLFPGMMKEERQVKEEIGAPAVGGAAKRGTKQPADSTLHPSERKRILHLHAEQSRRHALKDGFDQLLEIVPDVHSGGIKPTNAVVLAKAADHIKELRARRDDKNRRVEEVREQIRALNERISTLQASLPSSRRDETAAVDQRSAVEQFFERYTRERTKQDWRFWLMARMLKPIVSNYASSVHADPADRDMVAQSAAQWMRDHWRVSQLRPHSSEILVYLATSTRFLADPASLRDHVEEQNAK